MSKGVKLSLLALIALSVIGITAFYLRKQKSTKDTKAGSKESAPVAVTPTSTPTTQTGVVSAPSASASGANAVLAATTTTDVVAAPKISIRRIYPASGNVAGLMQKSGKTAEQIVQFLSWSANKDGHKKIEDWHAGWWISNFNLFPESYNKFASLSDLEYNSMFS